MSLHDLLSEQCETCGTGYYLHLGHEARCDHCNCHRHSYVNRNDRIREALKILYEEQVDYITINHPGDPHHNRSMQLARDALNL